MSAYYPFLHLLKYRKDVMISMQSTTLAFHMTIFRVKQLFHLYTAHISDLSIFYQLEGKNYFLKSGKAKSKGSNNFDIEIPYLSTNSDYKLLIKDEAGNCLCKENYNISIPYKENKRQIRQSH